MPASERHTTRPNRTRQERQAQDSIDRLGAQGGPFVAAVEATRMPMVVTDPTLVNNPIIYANGAFLKLCGYTHEEVLGQNYYFLSGSETDPEVARKIDTALGARQDIDIEVELYTKQGERITVMQFVSPVVDAEGRIAQHFASFIDITERKRLELRLRQMTEDLERRVKVRTDKLEQANRKLQDEVERRRTLEAALRGALEDKQKLLEEKEFMLKEVNHRVKNSLQTAQTFLMAQGLRNDDNLVKEALKSAGQHLSRLAELHEMLHQSEAAEQIEICRYLTTLCQNLISTYHLPLDQVSVDIEIEEQTWGPDLALPLALITNEAMSNALKYAFPDQGRGTILVALHSVAPSIFQLSIQDSGVGIPEQRRSDSLGLKLIDLLAGQIGGSASVVNQNGTIVTVNFPVQDLG